MKFNELPENIQLIAANTLSELLKGIPASKELADELASSVASAFVALYVASHF